MEYCERPFKNGKEHDLSLIENWNSVVKEGDTVYHLGDFGFGSRPFLINIIKQLKGKIHFIRGNHDKSIKGEVLNLFIDEGYYKEIKISDSEIGTDQKIILFHYPILSWHHVIYGSWQIHGHIHSKKISSEKSARLDVGVDCHNYRPISYDEVKIIMTRKMLNDK